MHKSEEKLHGEAESMLERGFTQVITPFQRLIDDQKIASLLLLGSTVLALLIANSPLGQGYETILQMNVGLTLGDQQFTMSIHHWINDGLMALFFFTLGLEIKRELLVGELRDPARSLPVVAAAIGGMALPALFYLLFNSGGEAVQGWAIPMATDTAFAIGILALLGNRIPPGLTTFLLALAIIDDVGAVMVIALFYSAALNTDFLLAALALLATLAVINLLGIRKPVIYFTVGGLVWLAMLGSGVHATIAGILVAITVPARPSRSSRGFLQRSRELIDTFEHFEEKESKRAPILAEPEKHDVVEQLQQVATEATTPLQMWERALNHPVALFVLPLFALANAGIRVDFGSLPALLSQDITMGILLGLVVGKGLGITLATMVVLALGMGRLPEGMSRMHLPGLGLLGGIGFTMSIFIAGLGFSGAPDTLLVAKAGIISASLLAGLCGYLWLRYVVPPNSSQQ